jgi:ketosteroid isomerase-like protein
LVLVVNPKNQSNVINRTTLFLRGLKEVMANIRELMTTYYKSGTERDWSTWLSLLDDKIVVDEQLAGHLEGIESMRTLSNNLVKHYSKFEIKPTYMIVEGDEVCTAWVIDATTDTGVPIHAVGANFCRFQNNKIVYMQNFHDTVPFASDTAYKKLRH